MSNPTQEQINEYVTLTKEKMSQTIQEQIAHFEKQWNEAKQTLQNTEAQMLQIQGAVMALKKLEVSPSKALEGINLSSGRSLVTMQRYPDYVIPRTFDFGFSLDLIKKDLNTACMVLKETGVAGHMMGKQLDLVKEAIEHVGPNADHLEMIKLLETWSQCKIED